MPETIPKGLTREHVLKALADLDSDIDHPFGRPTGYELVHDGKHYAPKAVVGIAFRHLTGEILHHSKFSGGEAPGQANYELRRLGFQVVSKGPEQPEEKTGTVWSDEEVALLVADYFDMLQLDLSRPAIQQSRTQPVAARKAHGQVQVVGRVQAPERQRRPPETRPADH